MTFQRESRSGLWKSLPLFHSKLSHCLQNAPERERGRPGPAAAVISADVGAANRPANETSEVSDHLL